jgi:hypothetical protein
MLGISSVASQLMASQEGLSSMKVASNGIRGLRNVSSKTQEVRDNA